MRKLLIDLLLRIPILTGINQGKELTEEQRQAVVTQLVKVCNQYRYLDDERKIKVLESSMMADKEFYGLTPKKAHQYLSSYWTGLPSGVRNKLMGETQPEYNAVPKEKAQEYINQWRKSLSKIEETKVNTFSSRIYGKEVEESVKVKQKVIDCRTCENKEPDKWTCPDCRGYGQIKVMA